MNSKAISPLIATVVLVAFAVSLSVMISSFMTSVTKDQTQTVSANSVCASKGALIIDSAMCTRVRDNSLVGYWKLDSVNASNYTLDSSGYGNAGNFSTGGSSATPVSGQMGNGLQFDGVDDYANISSLLNTGVTVEVWKKNSTDTSWYHVANSSGTLYVNGAAGSGQKIYVTNVSGNVVIGRDDSGGYFNGTIDEVKIYNRSLSGDEILQHYQKGLEKFAVDGYFKTIKASIRNIGTTPLSNFTILADINGRLYLNSTPQNGGLTLPAASEPLTLQANTYYDGPVKSLKVSVSNCPISMTMANDSSAIGTC